MAKIGFLGLGIMGYPMARNLRRAGHEVYVWSHTSAKSERLAREEGVIACATPKEAGAAVECAFFCVGDTAMSERVVFAPDGLAAGMAAGGVIVDTSTVSPSFSIAMGDRLATQGIHFLGAPCTGSRPGAEGGTLTFMIGGEKSIFERTKPYFEAMGKKLYYCGGPGLGLHAKLTQNLVLANLLQAFNEGLVLSTKAGVEPALMLDILDNSAAKSGLISYKAPFIFRRDFTTNFSVKWMHKDIGLMLDSASEQGVPVPLTALTRQMFQAAIAQGLGEDDICSTIKVLEGIVGVEVKSS